jgi:hypothetical protein
MKGSDKSKLLLAIVLLVAAAGLMWYFDVFGLQKPQPASAPVAAPAGGGTRSAPAK